MLRERHKEKKGKLKGRSGGKVKGKREGGRERGREEGRRGEGGRRKRGKEIRIHIILSLVPLTDKVTQQVPAYPCSTLIG